MPTLKITRRFTLLFVVTMLTLAGCGLFGSDAPTSEEAQVVDATVPESRNEIEAPVAAGEESIEVESGAAEIARDVEAPARPGRGAVRPNPARPARGGAAGQGPLVRAADLQLVRRPAVQLLHPPQHRVDRAVSGRTAADAGAA